MTPSPDEEVAAVLVSLIILLILGTVRSCRDKEMFEISAFSQVIFTLETGAASRKLSSEGIIIGSTLRGY